VASLHITLIEGYLTALSSSTRIAQGFELNFCASKSTFATLPNSLFSKIRFIPIPVMNQEKRRLVLKSFVEFFVVLRYLIKLRKGDVLFISCVLPTTLLLLELSNRLIRKTGMHVVLHGEVEGLFDNSRERFQSIGYWAVKWMQTRKSESLISLVVLDDFIRDKLLQEFPTKFFSSNVNVVYYPVLPVTFDATNAIQKPRFCFIGYRTRYKGFNDFLQMASDISTANFVAIGNGKVENFSDRTESRINNNATYLEEISKCTVAVFPYTSAYTCSLSAAALDALSTGVHIVALDRPFFRNLASHFGEDAITVRSSINQLYSELIDNRHTHKIEDRSIRLNKLANSKYSLGSVQRSFEKLVFNLTS
jgi:hypothetical protein